MIALNLFLRMFTFGTSNRRVNIKTLKIVVTSFIMIIFRQSHFAVVL